MTLRLKNFVLIGAFVVSTTMLGVAAWMGEKLAIVLLCVFSLAAIVLQQLTSSLTGAVLESNRDTLEYWKQESVFSRRLTQDNLQMVSLLYEYDPSAAELFQDRLSDALSERHPEAAEMAAVQAEMN